MEKSHKVLIMRCDEYDSEKTYDRTEVQGDNNVQ